VGSFGFKAANSILAYSSTSHIGLNMAFTSTFEGVQMLLFYLVIYMISGLCVYLLCLLRLKEKFDRKHNKEEVISLY
jgi:NADH:ubiquinone oxidoreductase subunit 2 (subunit N)